MSLDELHPGPWEVVLMKGSSPTPSQGACWIRHVTARGKPECVMATMTPGEAAEAVEKHNKKVSDDD